MEIKGFVGVSLSDWDGRVSSVIFLPGCNLRCPFCYNRGLVLQPEKMPTIPLEQIQNYLQTKRQWIDGVVITGGEPTLQRDLPLLCENIRKTGFGVKVDTNGTNPQMLGKLIEGKLVDYIALDIKAPLTTEKYSAACGVNAEAFLGKIEKTVQLLLNQAVEYEFRTTLVPTLHETEDMEAICRAIESCRKYALQNFKSEVETMDPRLQNVKPFSLVQMKSFLQTARKIVPNTILRG